MEFLARIATLFFPWPLRALLPGRNLELSLQGQYLLMSKAQHEVASWSYDQGRPHGFGETMRAIAWQESSFGVKLANPKDKGGGSYGIFGNSVRSTAVRHFKIKTWREDGKWVYADPTGENIAYVKLKLQQDRDFSARACLAELRYWYKTHGEDWPRIWASYNAGWRWDTRAGRWYAQQIADKINYLRTV